jgi:hypothetical protein
VSCLILLDQTVLTKIPFYVILKNIDFLGSK